MSELPEDLRAILVCPRCRGPLQDEPSALRCDACRVRYPVRGGIPILLADAGIPIDSTTRDKS
ncbi:MAG: Trm112 family protein [Candidatus Dormibacteraeota bacterium]|nr:Trm112 family protein [Candidatus Dormibacteraeota bacterium]